MLVLTNEDVEQVLTMDVCLQVVEDCTREAALGNIIPCLSRTVARESWWLALLFGAVAWGFIFGLFDWALHVPFPEGQLFQWVAF